MPSKCVFRFKINSNQVENILCVIFGGGEFRVVKLMGAFRERNCVTVIRDILSLLF